MRNSNDSLGRSKREEANQKHEDAGEVTLLLSREWTLIGYQGQALGKIGRCVADLSTGKLLSLEVATPSQKFPVEWSRVEIDTAAKQMRLRND